MTESQHAKAVRHANQSINKLDDLLAAIGTRDHPNGRIIRQYESTITALQTALDSPSTTQAVLQEFTANVNDIINQLLLEGRAIGEELGGSNLAVYDLPEAGSAAPIQSAHGQALAFLGGIAASQAASIMLHVMTGDTDPDKLFGLDGGPNLLSYVPVARETSLWATAMSFIQFDAMIKGGTQSAQGDFLRQAVAAIDERTTDTCVGVNGQIVLLNQPFELSGEFPGHKHHPPFHWWCRTTEALIRRNDMFDDITRQLRAAGEAEALARGLTNYRVEIHPASGVSGR